MSESDEQEKSDRAAVASRMVMRNSAWLIGQPLLLNVVSIASTGYIARKLGTEGFATFNIGLAFATMFSPLTNMGLRALTVRYVAQNRDDADDYISKVMTLRLALGLATLGIVVLLLPLSSKSPETRQVTLILSALLLLNTVVGVLTDALHAFEEMGHAARAMMWGGIVLTAASVVVVAKGGGPSPLAASYLIGPLVSVVILYFAVRRQHIRPRLIWDVASFRALLKEALPFFGQGIFDSMSGRIDLFILARTIGEAGLGGYTAAGQLVSRAMVVIDGASSALLPSLARSRVEDPASAADLLRSTLRVLLAFTVPMAVCVALAAPQILDLVFGAGYEDGAIVLTISILAMPITAAAMAIGHGLFVIHRNRLVVQSSIVATSSTSVMIVPATLFLGVIGAPLARVVGRFLLLFQRLPEALKNYAGIWRLADTLRVAAVTLISALPFVIMRMTGGSQLAFLLAVVAATPLYIGSMLLSGVLSDEIRVKALKMLRIN